MPTSSPRRWGWWVAEPFACDLCGYESSLAADLGKHVIASHPEMMSDGGYQYDDWFRCLCGLWFHLENAAVFGQHLTEKGGLVAHLLESKLLISEE